MPIYEYECSSCAHRYEKMVRIGAEAPACPACSSAEVRKLVSQSGFILKGGGWYKDHYGLRKSSADGGASKTEGGATTKSDSGAAAAPSGKESTGSSTSGGSSDSASSGSSGGTPAASGGATPKASAPAK